MSCRPTRGSPCRIWQRMIWCAFTRRSRMTVLTQRLPPMPSFPTRSGTGNSLKPAGPRTKAVRAAQVMDIWAQVYADAPDRLVRIIATQTGWLGLEDQILNAPLVIAEGLPAPASHFDAYAVTGYFSALLGADEKATMVRDWIAQSKAADPSNPYALTNQLAAQELRDGSVSGDPSDSLAAVLGEILPYQASVAANHGLRLMMYEGGTHVVGFGAQVDDPDLTAFFTQFNFSPEMGGLYQELLKGWQALSDAPFNAFVDVYRPSKWGSWGALRHLGDDNPRWQALAKGCSAC